MEVHTYSIRETFIDKSVDLVTAQEQTTLTYKETKTNSNQKKREENHKQNPKMQNRK